MQRPAPERDGAAPTETPATRDDTTTTRDETTTSRTAAAGPAAAATPGPTAIARARARQREEFGGINWGAELLRLARGGRRRRPAHRRCSRAAGAAIGLTGARRRGAGETETIASAAAIALLVVLMPPTTAAATSPGGCRASTARRQGIAAWVIGLLVTIVIALVAPWPGRRVQRRRAAQPAALPVGDETLAPAAWIATGRDRARTLLRARAGGKAGERYHRSVDRAGFVD